MKLSRESRYALTALTHLAQRPPGSVLKSRQIAAATQVPPAFLSKILNKLARGGIPNSARGGGYALARPADEITVREALVAVEGSDLFERCIFWRHECSIPRTREPRRAS